MFPLKILFNPKSLFFHLIAYFYSKLKVNISCVFIQIARIRKILGIMKSYTGLFNNYVTLSCLYATFHWSISHVQLSFQPLLNINKGLFNNYVTLSCLYTKSRWLISHVQLSQLTFIS